MNRFTTKHAGDGRQSTGAGETGRRFYSNDITARLSMSLNNTPLQGAHINVVSGNFTIAQPLGVDDGVDYCHSGRIRRIDEDAINRQLDNGAIVLMGPVASQ